MPLNIDDNDQLYLSIKTSESSVGALIWVDCTQKSNQFNSMKLFIAPG